MSQQQQGGNQQHLDWWHQQQQQQYLQQSQSQADHLQQQQYHQQGYFATGNAAASVPFSNQHYLQSQPLQPQNQSWQLLYPQQNFIWAQESTTAAPMLVPPPPPQPPLPAAGHDATYYPQWSWQQQQQQSQMPLQLQQQEQQSQIHEQQQQQQQQQQSHQRPAKRPRRWDAAPYMAAATQGYQSAEPWMQQQYYHQLQQNPPLPTPPDPPDIEQKPVDHSNRTTQQVPSPPPIHNLNVSAASSLVQTNKKNGMMKDNNTAPDRANANATQQPKGKSKKRSRSKRGKKKSKEKKSSPKQKTSASIVNSTGSFDEAEAEELYPEQIITSVWEKSREKANAPKRVTGTSLTKPGDDNMDFSSSENEEGEIAGDAKENSKGKEDKSADDEKSDKKASKKQLLVQAKQRLKEVQEKRQQLLEKKLQTEQEKQQAKYTASLDPSPSYGKYTATMGQEATAAASKPNSYNRKKFTIDEAQTKMREALQKKLQFMKKRNQYLQSSRGRQQVNRLSALEDNALNSLVIEDISSTGPEEKVRFVTVFAPPINVTEGAQASIGDPVDDTEMPGQFEDPNEEDHTANAAPVVTDESNARKNMQVRSAGQFDDPDKDAFLEIIPQTAAGSVDGDPGAKGIVPEEAPKPTSNSLADRLPKMLSKGERFNHLKSINALKRKMELRRKAIELKEKLQRLEQRGGGEVGRGSSESHRYQRQASTPSDNCSDGGDLTPPQQPSSREGKDQLSVTEADTTEQLQSQPVPAKPKIKYTKEELEKRRVKAQQNMDVTQMKHLVSKQAYLLDEQHKKVTNHEHDIRECDQLTTQLQEDLKTQSDKIVSLSVRQEIIDEMLQEKAKLLMAKRCELYQLQTRKKTSRNGMEIDENEAEDDDDDDDDDVLDE